MTDYPELEMIDRVAIAIGDTIEEAHISHLKLAARAVIEEIREPTVAMLAVKDQHVKGAEMMWKAMIDKALGK